MFSKLKSDIPASIVVFLVALPLCLGVALASGAPLLSGIISGIIGGIVVGFLSQSHTSVSGPAAGLSAVVLAGITQLVNFDVFLLWPTQGNSDTTFHPEIPSTIPHCLQHLPQIFHNLIHLNPLYKKGIV